MNGMTNGEAKAVADHGQGLMRATIDVARSPERVFAALASREILQWWVRPGVFDTREWTGEVRAGGRWQASGMGVGGPYTLEGEFIEIDRPTRLVHTWHLLGTPSPPTRVTYILEPLDSGTRVTLEQSGFTSAQACTNTAIGWETSFDRLAEILAAE